MIDIGVLPTQIFLTIFTRITNMCMIFTNTLIQIKSLVSSTNNDQHHLTYKIMLIYSVRPKPKFRPKFRSKSAETFRPKFRSAGRNTEIAKNGVFSRIFAIFPQFFAMFFPLPIMNSIISFLINKVINHIA